VLSEPVSRNQLTRCAPGNVLFHALNLRFVWVLISFWAKPFDNWCKIMHIGMGLSCCSLYCVMYDHMQAFFPSDVGQSMKRLRKLKFGRSLTEYKFNVTCTCCRLSYWSLTVLCANVRIHQNNFSEIYYAVFVLLSSLHGDLAHTR
jgi:hypothetical protein